MFFNDETKIKISCVISYKLLYPQFGECVGRCKRPLASWTGPETSGDTAGMLGHDMTLCLIIRRHSRGPRRPPEAA